MCICILYLYTYIHSYEYINIFNRLLQHCKVTRIFESKAPSTENPNTLNVNFKIA